MNRARTLAGERLAGATAILKHVAPDDVPASEDILSHDALEAHLLAMGSPRWSLIAGGDVMLAGRTRRVIRRDGEGYPLAAVGPLLSRGAIRLANLEGPFTSSRRRESDRNFAYRVKPALAGALRMAGLDVLTLANNHLVDCGRRGVKETLSALREAGIAAIGAGLDARGAHAPAILEAGGLRVGLLGYYWNRRTAATDTLPGSAMDPPELLEADIRALRARVDRVVATFHWGVPYEREPGAAEREKARLAIDLGADVVIGHHTHVVQPFEIHRGKPIFYGVGNFAFGSGNSKAEGILLAIDFEPSRTVVDVFPLYVKNRDPRVDYQPKVLAGAAASRSLAKMAAASGEHGRRLSIDHGRGRLVLPGAANG